MRLTALPLQTKASSSTASGNSSAKLTKAKHAKAMLCMAQPTHPAAQWMPPVLKWAIAWCRNSRLVVIVESLWAAKYVESRVSLSHLLWQVSVPISNSFVLACSHCGILYITCHIDIYIQIHICLPCLEPCCILSMLADRLKHCGTTRSIDILCMNWCLASHGTRFPRAVWIGGKRISAGPVVSCNRKHISVTKSQSLQRPSSHGRLMAAKATASFAQKSRHIWVSPARPQQ